MRLNLLRASGLCRGMRKMASTIGSVKPTEGRAHRSAEQYVHKLYALDTELGTLTSPTKQHVLDAMQGHVLAESVLIGTYARHSS